MTDCRGMCRKVCNTSSAQSTQIPKCIASLSLNEGKKSASDLHIWLCVQRRETGLKAFPKLRLQSSRFGLFEISLPFSSAKNNVCPQKFGSVMCEDGFLVRAQSNRSEWVYTIRGITEESRQNAPSGAANVHKPSVGLLCKNTNTMARLLR